MAAFLTDQNEEIEVLLSIFPTEFLLVSDSPNTIKILLSPLPLDDKDNHVAVNLISEFPSTYPNESAPILIVEPVKGLGKKQIDELKVVATKSAEENIGMPSIYIIAEAIKEWLADNNVPGQDGSMYAEMVRKQQQKDMQTKKQTEKAAVIAAADSESRTKPQIDPEEEERIRRRQAGTAVTVESFMAWKAAFDEEMRLKALAERGGKEIASTERLTGKQLFLANSRACLEDMILAQIAAEEGEEGEGVEGVEVGGGGGREEFGEEEFEEGEEDFEEEGEEEYDDEEEEDDVREDGDEVEEEEV